MKIINFSFIDKTISRQDKYLGSARKVGDL